MRRTIVILALLVSTLIAGCGTDEKVGSKEEVVINQDQLMSANPVLYESDAIGVQVLEAPGWSLTKSTNESATFQNESVLALVTIVSKNNSVAEIKKDLISNAGSSAIIEEDDYFISWQSKRNESIQTEIFIEEGDSHYVLVTFMTPTHLRENIELSIKDFKNSLKIN